MGKLAQIEEKINNLLIKLSDKIYARIEKYIPQFYFNFKRDLAYKKDQLILEIKDFLKKEALKFKEKFIVPALNYNYTEFFNQKKQIIIEYLLKKKNEVLKKEYWKEQLQKVKRMALFLLQKISNLNFTAIFLTIGTIAALYFITVFAYNQFLNYFLAWHFCYIKRLNNLLSKH